ncbi:MAG: GNAT family N-acetyltransferase [Eubacteriales bacterium]
MDCVKSFFEYVFKLLKIRSYTRILFMSEAIKNNTAGAGICNVTCKNIKDVCAYEADKYLKKYTKFLANGDIGYYAYLDGNWVHRTWIAIGPVFINKWTRFPPFRIKAHEAYCHFCETAPAARGNNIPAAVLSKAAADLKGRINRFYTLVDENNVASRRVMEKSGFKEIKRFRITGIFWFDFYREIK